MTTTEKGIYDLLRERLEAMTPEQRAEWVADKAEDEGEEGE